jgi:signal transduction histidine kinase
VGVLGVCSGWSGHNRRMRADRRWRFEAESAPHRTLPSVRARSALAAGLVVALTLGAGTAVLFYLLQRTMLSSLDQAATSRAADFADRISVIGEQDLDATLKETRRDDQVVQVIDARNRVVASSRSSAGIDGDRDGRTGDDAPLTGLRAQPGQVVREHAGPRKILDRARPYIVLAHGVSFQDDDYTVIVGTSFRPQRASILTLVRFAAGGLPVLVLLVSGATWVLVDRALKPVEVIRRRVAGIGAGDLDDRVPVPPTRDEIARLAVTMNQMLDRLQSGQQAQRQFVADASHELRSPLATLAATLEVAAADPSGQTWAELRTVMEDETGRMAVLVENLLVLAKVDDQGLVLRVTDVDLDDLLEEEVRRVRAATALEVVARIEPVRVAGDVLRLGQAIRNVVDNAARHARTRIELTLASVDGAAVLTVQDDGPGIPPAQRERVFERFVRLDDSRDRASGGSGLGLPIVLEVVKGHHGTVEIGEPIRPPGCLLVIRLPLPSGDGCGNEEETTDGEQAQPPRASIR